MKRMKRTLGFIVWIVILGAGIKVFGLLGFGDSVHWQEEVLLHDGSKIIVDRSQSYGGRHEIGQSSPIKEQNITFTVPETKKAITWTSEYSKDVGRANFILLALHILNGRPYLVASPNLCLSYNKWGRPNPPYVFLKYDGAAWQRILLEEFPFEFKTLNVTIETKGHEKELVSQGLMPAEIVKNLNSNLRQPEYRRILREPLKAKEIGCPAMIPDGKNGWVGFDVGSIHSYAECLKVCKFHNLSKQFCPCDNLLQTKPEWR